MSVLTHRVLPTQARAVKSDLSRIGSEINSGNALNLGDTGKAVSALQRQLTTAGVYKGPITGIFDPPTATAVAALQKSKHLEASGIVGGRTLKALKSTQLFVKDGFDKPAVRGQSGSDIRTVEARLAKLGFRPGKVDGVFDKDTSAAVERYRKADGQVPDKGHAITDRFSRELAKASGNYNHGPYSRREVGKVKQHKRLDALAARAAGQGSGVGLGDKGRAARVINRHLEAAGFELGNAEAARFGSRSEAATKAFQKSVGLSPTGVVDSKTWSKLKDKSFAADSATSPAQRVGERDGAVKATEKKLKVLGLKPGKVDGLFSKGTAKAVRKFQRKHKLHVSGSVGGATMRALNKAVKAKQSGGPAVAKMLNIARRALGYHEGAGNSNKFSRAMGRPAEAWCADFVSYLAKKAGTPTVNTASAQGIQDQLAAKGRWKGQHNPKPGDAVTFNWSGSKGWADHVGIVEKVFKRGGQTWVQTIEGNSSDAVRRKTYPMNASVIKGFGRIA